MSGAEPIIYAYLAATAVELAGQQEQKRERRNILNASLADAERTQKDAVQQVTTEAEQLSPEARMRQMAGAESAAYGRTMGDIQGAGGAAIDTAVGGLPSVSADYTRALGERTTAENDRLSAIARELAKVRAPQEVAMESALRRGAMAERLGSLWSSQRARSDASRRDAEAVDMPEWGQLAGLVKTGLGAYMGGGAGAAAGAASMSGMDMAGDAPVGSGNNVGGMGGTAGGKGPSSWWTAKPASNNRGQSWAVRGRQ